MWLKYFCFLLEQVGMDLRCRQAGEHPHSLHPLSMHSWSQPQRAALLHLRAILSRATPQHLSLVSNSITLTDYALMPAEELLY